MPRFRVPTDAGTFEVDTPTENPTEEELLSLIGESAPEEPGLARRGLALAARVGTPIAAGALGFALTAGNPLGAAAGAGAGGAAGESLAEYILNEPQDLAEIALSGALAAVPAGPFARAAAKPGISVARQVALHAAEGATQGVLAAEAQSVVKEGEPAGIPQLATGAVAGAALGGALGRVTARGARPVETPEVPLSPQTAAAEAVTKVGQGELFTRVPGLGGEVPPRGPVRDSRIADLHEDVDRLFPDLGAVEKLSLKDLITRDGEAILEHGRGVQGHERTDALAGELVLDLSKPLPAGTALNAEQLRHVVNVIPPLQERVTALAGEVVARPDDVLKLKLQHASTQLTNAVLSYSGASTEAGRTLNILKAQAKALAQGDLKAILQARKLGVDADQIAKVIANSPNDPVSQYRQLRDMYRPDWKDKARWFYYTNILSGPRTHVRNLVSNTVSLALRPASAPFSAAAAKLSGREQEVFAGEAPIMALQAYRAMPEAWNKALFMFKNGFSLSDVEDFEIRAPEIGGGVAINAISRGLSAADEFFRTLGFNMELHAGAFSRARRQATKEGLTGDALVSRTADLTAELLDRKPPDLLDQAEKFSRRVTFQERDNEVANALVALRNKVPGGSFLLPFVRTPANIFRQGVQFSPAGLVTKAGRAAGRAGQQARGEAVLGSALLLPVAWLAATGNMTGAAPSDAGERDAFYAEGKRPNSVKIANTWLSFTEAGPLVLPFAVVANAFDAYRRTGEISEETVGQIVGQVGKATLDMSYLSGLSAIFQAFEDPERYGQALIQNLAAGAIPGVGLLRNVRDVVDPSVRQAATFAEGLKRNVPGLSSELLPRLDALGQPAEKPSGLLALTVPAVSSARFDPVREELRRVGVEPEPLKRVKEVKVGESRFPLDDKADFALRRAAGTFRAILLRDLFADPTYQGAPVEDQQKAIQRALRQAGTAATEGARALLREGQPITFEALTSGVSEPEVPPPSAAPEVGGRPHALDPILSAAGQVSGVDPTFLKAVAFVESRLDPEARGEKTKYGTAVGLMQILPSTFRVYESEARGLLGHEPSIDDPEDNALVGALYYRDLLDQTGNDPAAAAAMYHGGPSTKNHGPRTRKYAEDVAATYARMTGGG